ncbi:stability/partitioning determinant (plasmid) [Candidatus Symbiopectobacterium sp. 'North America']|uniref:stability/ partitioning determinant n=1 Tax=Candidatus Symbiopectobacterium sp. 'North America' TaxID=2794574 RepID=UPI0018CBC265|nr:stability/ partitioning determinant [Candidatus Symbiopectobacterium sp. 'North America']MBG6246638.1 stability/partitioning determinant [Candidatus Symbiopectobacterium sp. 'North America']
MAIQLKKPAVAANVPQTGQPSATEKAQFIAAGERRPNHYTSKTTPTTFRLPQWLIDILESEAGRTGHNKTDILKAMAYGYSKTDEGQINVWLLESKKM